MEIEFGGCEKGGWNIINHSQGRVNEFGLYFCQYMTAILHFQPELSFVKLENKKSQGQGQLGLGLTPNRRSKDGASVRDETLQFNFGFSEVRFSSRLNRFNDFFFFAFELGIGLAYLIVV